MKLLNLVRDWWRGYSDKDVISACNKIDSTIMKLGGITYLTNKEFKAMHGQNIHKRNAQHILKQKGPTRED